MKSTKVLFVTAVLAVVLAWAGAAHADTQWLNLQYTGDSPTETGWISGPYVVDGSPQHVYVGASNFSISDPGNLKSGVDYSGADALAIANDAVNGSITGYCVDVTHWINPPYPSGGPAHWTLQSLPAMLSSLYGWTTAQADVKATDLTKLWQNYCPVGTNASDPCLAAAFGASVWEIVNATPGTSYNLTTGSFTVTPDGGTWIATAQGWLNSLSSLSNPTETLEVLAPADPTTQNFGIIVPGLLNPNYVPPVVPEPLTMFSAFLAVSSVGMYVRKHTAKSKTA